MRSDRFRLRALIPQFGLLSKEVSEMSTKRTLTLAVGALLALGTVSGVTAQETKRRRVAPPQSKSQTAKSDDKAGAENGEAAGSNRGPNGAQGPWNDPGMRLRMMRRELSNRRPTGGPGGGRGGRGGPGGFAMGGGMTSLLLRSPMLQDEIKLSEKQKEALTKFGEETRTKQREMFRTMFNNGGQGGPGGGGPGGPGGGPGGPGGPGRGQGGPGGAGGPGGEGNNGRGGRGGPGGPGGGRPNFDPAQMQQMQQAMMELQQQTQATFNKILSPAQQRRLEEIRLRIIGPTAVAEEAIAQKLMLSEEQFAQVGEIMAQMDQKERELMMAAFGRGQRGPGGNATGNGGGPGGPGGPNGGGPGGPAQAGPGGPGGPGGPAQAGPGGPGGPGGNGNNADGGNANGNRRRGFDPNSPEFQQMQERMRQGLEEQDQALKDTEKALGKVLMPAQKSRFNKMLGAEFDVMALAGEQQQGGGPGFGGFGGPGGPGGGRGPGQNRNAED